MIVKIRQESIKKPFRYVFTLNSSKILVTELSLTLKRKYLGWNFTLKSQIICVNFMQDSNSKQYKFIYIYIYIVLLNWRDCEDDNYNNGRFIQKYTFNQILILFCYILTANLLFITYRLYLGKPQKKSSFWFTMRGGGDRAN